MRIACLYLPGFLLQVHARRAPHVGQSACAVLRGGRVVEASRRALEGGVRVGVTAAQARAVVPDLRLVDDDPAACDQAARALGEALLALSPTVDVTERGAVYALVPPGSRGAAFGERVLAAAATQGLRGRVGIADDRFTAWAATQARPRRPVRAVAAGGSAAFLAKLPLDLLPLDEDVRRMLVALRVQTIGDFAALPPPSVGRRFERHGVDVQALARGDDPRALAPLSPAGAIEERVELPAPLRDPEAAAFALRPLCERATARLAGRRRAAARVVVALLGAAGERAELALVPSPPAGTAGALAALLGARLAGRPPEHAIVALDLAVADETPAPPEAPGLLDAAAPAPPPAPPRERRVLPVAFRGGGAALRLVDPPETIETDVPAAALDPPPAPRALRVGGAERRVAWAAGPTRLAGDWWTDEPLARDYYELATEDGARYWVYRDHADGRFYLHGVFDGG